MTEILVRWSDQVDPDSKRDAEFSAKRGDPVFVQDVAAGDVVWGLTKFELPDWVILEVPGLNVEHARARLLAPEREEDAPIGAVDVVRDVDADGNVTLAPKRMGPITRFRGVRLDLAQLPAGQLRALERTGRLTLTPAQFRSLARTKGGDREVLG